MKATLLDIAAGLTDLQKAQPENRFFVVRLAPNGDFHNLKPTENDILVEIVEAPVPMILACPICGERHIDEGLFATKNHHTHACQNCGLVWRPALVATVGVQFLPGFKNEPTKK